MLRARILGYGACVWVVATAVACGARSELYVWGDAGDATVLIADAAPDTPRDPPCSAANVGYHDVHDPRFWSTFDIGPLIPMRGNSFYEFYIGAAFDGRYVYLVPGGDYAHRGETARYDTSAPFNSPSSWTSFEMASINPRAAAFAGAAFDGRYVYYVPSATNLGVASVMTRYDTRLDFRSLGAWATFDQTTLPTHPVVFAGAVFDGTYVYFVGNPVLRFDTRLDFTSPSSWSSFKGTTYSSVGAAFDGRYLYFPTSEGSGPSDVVRYDTHADFLDAGSWSGFSTYASLSPSASGFEGEGFDGTYAYFVPGQDQFGKTGIATRVDTRLPFQDASSWSAFDVNGANPKAGQFAGAAFDGRFFYLVPNGQGDSGTLARYDTAAQFASTSSWSTFDMTTLSPQAAGFFGAAFDGRFVYFVPLFGSVVARFDAKCPPSLPRGYSGSFF